MVRAPLLRSFGDAADDLDLDFGSSDRPALVTALLAACAAPADAGHWWQRPVGERISALLALLRDREGTGTVASTIRCEAPGCGARLEIDLPLAPLAVAPPPSPTIAVARDEGDPLELRRPTGDDLRAWRTLRPGSREQAVMAMLACLSVSGEPRAEDAAPAAEALAEADPLVAFTVVCACPTCGHEAEYEIDLEGLALQRLAAHQRALLRDVHTLASRYGWSEAQILALTPGRRARYRELIEGLE